MINLKLIKYLKDLSPPFLTRRTSQTSLYRITNTDKKDKNGIRIEKFVPKQKHFQINLQKVRVKHRLNFLKLKFNLLLLLYYCLC